MPVINVKWDWEINSKTSFWSHGIRELWSYRYLLAGLVRRNFLVNYQQTILGPLWILIQPLITLATYFFVFNKLAGISTGSLPPVLFYSAGIILWNFFNDSFSGTSGTFKDNANIFSKVYFPRIIMPASVICTQFLRFLIQLLMLLALIAFYYIFLDLPLSLSIWSLAFPVAIIGVGAFSLGLGLLFSVFTAKYRDLVNIVALGIRMFMFVTPVIYPLGFVSEKVRWIVQLNPLSSLFELFRLSLLGEGFVTVPQLLYSFAMISLTLAGAILFFNKQGDKLIDIV
ncbi:ABC transporter permease [Pontibacter beigongshangensis]|uniref:ABC transporter permease n=1 Tax=Pontibacter beigongshangensis TaxID=2574733 RepID=UPI001650A1C2|nr:ABC transporter permease [Pontibacter beigongshangensis]